MTARSPNVAWALEAFERWNSGDRTPPLERFDPDVEIRTVIGDAFQGEPYRGHEGVRAWLAALDENFQTWTISVEGRSCSGCRRTSTTRKPSGPVE